jgi:hypothetical protein
MFAYRKLSFKNYDERKASVDKICHEADQMKQLFVEMAPRQVCWLTVNENKEKYSFIRGGSNHSPTCQMQVEFGVGE